MGNPTPKRTDAMPTFQVAHLRRDGQDIIIVPVDRTFGKRSPAEQSHIQEAFQRSAVSVEMNGVVVPVWEDAAGRMAFRAPPPLSLIHISEPTRLGMISYAVFCLKKKKKKTKETTLR